MASSLRFPTPYTVIMLVIVLSALATWLIPAGIYHTLSYDAEKKEFSLREGEAITYLPAEEGVLEKLGIGIALEKFTEGKIKKPISVPGTYQQVEATPQGIWEILFAPVRGLYEAIDIILFVLIIGGFMGVFSRSGAFDAGIAYLAQRLKGRESLLIVLVTTLIALGGTTFGLAEETLAFYPLLVPVFLAAGYDLLVPVAVIYIGSSIGNMGAAVNPFSTIVASDAAGVDWTIGFWSRIAMLLLGTAVCILYIIRYANSVKANPAQSMVVAGGVAESPAAASSAGEASAKMSGMNKLLLLLFALTFVLMIWGVSVQGWWFEEMTVLFLVAAIIIGLLQHMSEYNFIEAFIDGARDLLGVSLIIGIARGVTIVLNEGRISDTLLYYAASGVEHMSGFVFLPALMAIYFVLTLFISSSSGMAVVTMPIMGSLSSIVGVPTEEIVNAYLFGFGLMTFITPTGLILPSLAMVSVKYNVWLRFIWPLLVMLAAIAIGILWAGLAW